MFDRDGSIRQFGNCKCHLGAASSFTFEGPGTETVAPGSELRVPVSMALGAEGEKDAASVEVSLSGMDGLAREIRGLPSGRLEWAEHQDEDGVCTRRGTWLADGPLPDHSCLLRLEARVGGRIASYKHLHVWDGRMPAVEVLDDGWVVLRKLAGEQEHSSGWHEAEMERGLVGRQIHLLGGIEAGHLDYVFDLPEGTELTASGSVTLLAELSSKRQVLRESGQQAQPSYLEVYMNDVRVHCMTLGDQYAGADGALSRIYGFWERYGELVRVEVAGQTLSRVAAAASDKVRLRLAVSRHERPGGLIVYSSCAGRYPVDLTLIIRPPVS